MEPLPWWRIAIPPVALVALGVYAWLRPNTRANAALIGAGLMAGYGSLHDQVSVRLCPEYFTVLHNPIPGLTDPTLLDVFVLVNDQKVFFKGRTPDDGDKLKFTTEFPQKEGNNFVTVVARETQDFASRKTVVIRRRAPAVAQKVSDEAPKQAKP